MEPLWLEIESPRKLEHLGNARCHVVDANRIAFFDIASSGQKLFDALEQASQFFFEEKRVDGRPRENKDMLEDLLVKRLSDPARRAFLSQTVVKNFVNIEPPVVDCKKKNSALHSRLKDVYPRSILDEKNRLNDVGCLLIDALYVVRCNLDHGEKTPYGPDLKKGRRDREVCKVVNPLLSSLFLEIFGHPENYLAVLPEAVPEIVQRFSLDPTKMFPAQIEGKIIEIDGRKSLIWEEPGAQIDLQVLFAPTLSEKLPSLEPGNRTLVLLSDPGKTSKKLMATAFCHAVSN